MKIIFTIQRLDGFGGAQRVLVNIANRFAEDGYEVELIALRGDTSIYPLHDNIKIHCVTELAANSKHISEKLKKLGDLRRLIQRISPDVVVSFDCDLNILTLVSLLGVSIPVIACERNDPFSFPKRRILRLIRKPLYQKAKGLVFQTKIAQEFFPKKIQTRSILIPNPVRKDLPEPNRKTVEKVIVSAGRLTRQKNHRLLIEAFAEISDRYPDYKLVIYGDGEMRNELETLVDQMHLTGKVLFYGEVEDLPARLQNAAMFVLSSDYEGIPNVLLEAMAMGVPSVSTNCPSGGPELLIENNVNGVLVPVGDRKELAKQMDRLLHSPETLQRISRNAVLVREKYHLENVYAMWKEYLHQVIAEETN